MMAAIGEGFEVLEKSQFDYDYEKSDREYGTMDLLFVHG